MTIIHRHVATGFVVLDGLVTRALLCFAQLLEELLRPHIHGEGDIESVLLPTLGPRRVDAVVGGRAEGDRAALRALPVPALHGLVAALGTPWGWPSRPVVPVLLSGELRGPERQELPRCPRRRGQTALGLCRLDRLGEAPVGIRLGVLGPLDEVVDRLLQPHVAALDLLPVLLHVGHPALDHPEKAYGQARLLLLDRQLQVREHVQAHLLRHLRVLGDHVGGE
mmetsp:Transcript_7168/g.21185  ORF Transcript_7168/g.21185 Transcript_7168/m.21185 type:complete len:223 (-) Transcript_7168:1555-2223(-)